MREEIRKFMNECQRASDSGEDIWNMLDLNKTLVRFLIIVPLEHIAECCLGLSPSFFFSSSSFGKTKHEQQHLKFRKIRSARCS